MAFFLCVLGMYEVFMVKSPGAGNLASLKKNLGRGWILKIAIYNGNRTGWSPGVRFASYKYDYRQNWTT